MQEKEEEEEDEERVKRILSLNGILKGHVLSGVCTAQYDEKELKLGYSYKVVLSFISLANLLRWSISRSQPLLNRTL